MVVLATDISATGLLSAFTRDRFFLATDFFALVPVRWTLGFILFGIERFAAILRTGLALVWPRFDFFLRTATRFFAFAIAISCRAAQAHLKTSDYLIAA
jgi:hypothetical protein